MDDTQSYLNTILQKRANAVPNPFASHSRNTKQQYDGMTRVPVVQQREEDMPTVFRKKVDSMFNSNMHEQSGYGSGVQYVTGWQQQQQYNREPPGMPKETNANQSRQRVEYMLITKRIELKDQEEDPVLQQLPEHSPIRLVEKPMELNQISSPYASLHQPVLTNIELAGSIKRAVELDQPNPSIYSQASDRDKKRRKIFE